MQVDGPGAGARLDAQQLQAAAARVLCDVYEPKSGDDAPLAGSSSAAAASQGKAARSATLDALLSLLIWSAQEDRHASRIAELACSFIAGTVRWASQRAAVADDERGTAVLEALRFLVEKGSDKVRPPSIPSCIRTRLTRSLLAAGPRERPESARRPHPRHPHLGRLLHQCVDASLEPLSSSFCSRALTRTSRRLCRRRQPAEPPPPARAARPVGEPDDPSRRRYSLLDHRQDGPYSLVAPPGRVWLDLGDCAPRPHREGADSTLAGRLHLRCVPPAPPAPLALQRIGKLTIPTCSLPRRR